MRYIRVFGNFKQHKDPVMFWEAEINGKIVRVTFTDVVKYLEGSIKIDPNNIKHLLIDTNRDPNRIKTADLSYPIILVKSKGKFISILDGQHRVIKAIRDSVDIKAKFLDLDLAPEKFVKVLKNNK